MRREELEHLIRAACDATGDTEIIVIGSQAIHASFPQDKLPAATTLSNEADLLPIGGGKVDDSRGDIIVGALGEFSAFHQSHGVYGDAVDYGTATLPAGWEERLLRFESANTNGCIGWCLERHDLAVAKLVAARPKDIEFLDSLFRANRMNALTVAERFDSTPVTAAQRERMMVLLARVSRIERSTLGRTGDNKAP